MVDKVSGFIQKRRKAKLYEQWVRMDGLPQEDVPEDAMAVKRERPSGWSEASMEDAAEEDMYRTRRQPNTDRGLVFLPIRYLWLGGGLITLLLVILAIVSTVLIMRSC